MQSGRDQGNRMALTVTAETIDGHIASALTYIQSGNYVEARRSVTLAQVAKKALHRSYSADGVSREWDSEIRDVLAAISALEASEAKKAMGSRLAYAKVSSGRS